VNQYLLAGSPVALFHHPCSCPGTPPSWTLESILLNKTLTQVKSTSTPDESNGNGIVLPVHHSIAGPLLEALSGPPQAPVNFVKISVRCARMHALY
jgi:hypothetical protein